MMARPFPQENAYTIQDIYALPEGERAELIDGQIYSMAPPNRRHQEILSFLHLAIGNYMAKTVVAAFSERIRANIYTDLEIDFSKLQS